MKRRILIVEDDSQIRNFNCFAVENAGLEYAAAANGAEATGKLLSERIDLILLDLGLPDIDGMEIIKKCANGRRCRSSSSPPATRTKKKPRRWTRGRMIT